jgi:hypothetical protein
MANPATDLTQFPAGGVAAAPDFSVIAEGIAANRELMSAVGARIFGQLSAGLAENRKLLAGVGRRIKGQVRNGIKATSQLLGQVASPIVSQVTDLLSQNRAAISSVQSRMSAGPSFGPLPPVQVCNLNWLDKRLPPTQGACLYAGTSTTLRDSAGNWYVRHLADVPSDAGLYVVANSDGSRGVVHWVAAGLTVDWTRLAWLPGYTHHGPYPPATFREVPPPPIEYAGPSIPGLFACLDTPNACTTGAPACGPTPVCPPGWHYELDAAGCQVCRPDLPPPPPFIPPVIPPVCEPGPAPCPTLEECCPPVELDQELSFLLSGLTDHWPIKPKDWFSGALDAALGASTAQQLAALEERAWSPTLTRLENDDEFEPMNPLGPS